MSEFKENIQIDSQQPVPLPTDFLYRELNKIPETRISQDTLPLVEKIYDRIQDQIKTADAKAGALLAFNITVIGLLVSNYEKFIPLLSLSYFLFLLITFSLLLATSSILALLVFVSRFGGNTPSTKIFWGHIKDKYGFNYTKYHTDICAMTFNEQILDFSKQITEVSNIAATKHKYSRRGIIVAAVSVIIAIPLCGTFLYEKHKEYKENLNTENVRTMTKSTKTEIMINDNFLSKFSIPQKRFDIPYKK